MTPSFVPPLPLILMWLRRRLRGGRWQAGLLACLLAAVTLAGCGKSKTVAIVNGTKIEKDDFYHELERTYGVSVLNWMILQQLLKDACAAQGITIGQKELDKAVADWKKSQGFVGDQALYQWLKARNMTLQDLREDLEMELMRQKLKTHGVKVSDEEVRQFFETHKAQLGRPATATIQEVVCKTKAEAEQARKKLLAGASMAEVVNEFMAPDPMLRQLKEHHGQWPPRKKSDIYPVELQGPAFELPVGQVSKPIKSSLGFYHLIKVTQRSAAEPADFAKVKEQLREELKVRKGKTDQQLLQELTAKARVKVEWPEYLAVQEQFTRPAVAPGTLPGGAKPLAPGQGVSPAPIAPPSATPRPKQQETGTKAETGTK